MVRFPSAECLLLRLYQPMYMKDWIERLDVILQLNRRELLTHAGKTSHQMALNKSTDGYERYKENKKTLKS